MGGMGTGLCGYRIVVLGLAFLLALLAGGGDNLPLAAQETPRPAAVIEPAVTVRADNRQPAAASSYTVGFTAAVDLPPGQSHPIILTLHEDIGVPPQLNPQGIRITADQVSDLDGTARGAGAGRPLDLTLTGQDDPRDPAVITIYLGDMGASDGLQQIAAGARVTITFSGGVGLSNPAEGGRFLWTVQVGNDAEAVAAAHPEALVRQAFGEPAMPAAAADLITGLLVDREVVLSSPSAGRGTELVAIGRGFKNDTTLTFWRDGNFNGVRESNESVLCVTQVGRDDIGSCSFPVQSPPFAPGAGDCVIRAADRVSEPNCNLVNAVDGRGQSATLVLAGDNLADVDDIPILELDGLVQAEFGSGHQILIHLADFPPGELASVAISGQSVAFPNLTVGAGGALTFSVAAPPELRTGYHDLRVAVTRRDNGEEFAARATVIVVSGPVVRATPWDVLPNQRIHLTGNGFSLADGGEPVTIAAITLNGDPIDAGRIYGGGGSGRSGTIGVDVHGNWSATIDLPVNRSTTTPGKVELRVRDSRGRAGSVEVVIEPRELTVTPAWGRVGSTVMIEGRHFPGRNDQGSSLLLQVIYDAGRSQALATAAPDERGYFTAEVRVPRAAGIPSTNPVRVEFRDDDGALVSTLAAHDVPGAALTLSPSAGPPGTAVTVAGQGFREFVPAQWVKVGSLEVTPAPRPATDGQGRVTMQFPMPGLAAGTQTVQVAVAGVTASAEFTVTPLTAAVGAATPAAAALADLGGRLRRVFHFDNATKEWTFYDPEVAAVSTLDNLVAGESYWVLVGETAEVILNGKSRQLTCAGGNCWNLVVW